MKLVGVIRTNGLIPIGVIRTIWPLQALQQRGHDIAFLGDREIEEIARTGDDSVLDNADIIILNRIHGEPQAEDPFAKARAMGTKIVYETDDDLTCEHRWLGEAHRVEDAVKWADAVTVSTGHLGKVMERYGKPVYVLPNLVHVNWYEKQATAARRQIAGVTVGLVGTRSHFFDWLIVRDALREIVERYPQVVPVIGGYAAPYLKEIERAQYMAPVPFARYPAMLAQLDIRLCPVDVTDPFNASKSGIAVLEAMAATRHLKGKRFGGAVPIATDCPQYRHKFREEEGCLVQNTTEQWVAAIERFLDKGTRLRAQESCRQTVRHFDVMRGVEERERVYKEMCDGSRG